MDPELNKRRKHPSWRGLVTIDLLCIVLSLSSLFDVARAHDSVISVSDMTPTRWPHPTLVVPVSPVNIESETPMLSASLSSVAATADIRFPYDSGSLATTLVTVTSASQPPLVSSSEITVTAPSICPTAIDNLCTTIVDNEMSCCSSSFGAAAALEVESQEANLTATSVLRKTVTVTVVPFTNIAESDIPIIDLSTTVTPLSLSPTTTCSSTTLLTVFSDQAPVPTSTIESVFQMNSPSSAASSTTLTLPSTTGPDPIQPITPPPTTEYSMVPLLAPLPFLLPESIMTASEPENEPLPVKVSTPPSTSSQTQKETAQTDVIPIKPTPSTNNHTSELLQKQGPKGFPPDTLTPLKQDGQRARMALPNPPPASLPLPIDSQRLSARPRRRKSPAQNVLG